MAMSLLLCCHSWLFGVYTPAAQECFALVKQLDSNQRHRIQKELARRPSAVWAVVWGSQRENIDIAAPCLEILDGWTSQAELSNMVYRARGDFDRFVNMILHPEPGDRDVFAKASDVARILDRYFVRRSRDVYAKGFDSLGSNPRLATPFQDYGMYLQAVRPTVFEGVLHSPQAKTKKYLARCESINTDELNHSIALSQGT